MTVKQPPQGQTRGHWSSTLDSKVNQVGGGEISAQLEEILTEIRTIRRLVTAAPSTRPMVSPTRNTLDDVRSRLRRNCERGMYIVYLNVRLPDHASADACLHLSTSLAKALMDDEPYRFDMDDHRFDMKDTCLNKSDKCSDMGVGVAFFAIILYLLWVAFLLGI